MGRLLLSRIFVPDVAILCATFFILRPAGVDGPMPEAIPQAAKGFDHQLWSTLISKIRKPDGRVDFAAVRTNQDDLDKYLDLLLFVDIIDLMLFLDHMLLKLLLRLLIRWYQDL